MTGNGTITRPHGLAPRHGPYVDWSRWANRNGDTRTYRQVCEDLGYPTDREMVFDGAGNPYPYGWDSVAGVDDARDPFARSVEAATDYGPEHETPIPYALPVPYAVAVGPQEEWEDSGPPRDAAFYRGREDALRKFILAGISAEECGLVRLSAGELRKLWCQVAKLANVD
jgi:hypothetical protein